MSLVISDTSNAVRFSATRRQVLKWSVYGLGALVAAPSLPSAASTPKVPVRPKLPPVPSVGDSVLLNAHRARTGYWEGELRQLEVELRQREHAARRADKARRQAEDTSVRAGMLRGFYKAINGDYDRELTALEAQLAAKRFPVQA